MDPESAYYGDFGGGFAPSEVIVKSKFRIHDQVAVAVDFMQNIRTLWPKLSYFDKNKVLVPHNTFYSWLLRTLNEMRNIDEEESLNFQCATFVLKWQLRCCAPSLS